jgi:TfoX/Sxy family transcriptional regulator of competence genes
MKPFRPSAKQTLKSYYQVPVDIVEDGDRLCQWAMKAIRCQKRKNAIVGLPFRLSRSVK